MYTYVFQRIFFPARFEFLSIFNLRGYLYIRKYFINAEQFLLSSQSLDSSKNSYPWRIIGKKHTTSPVFLELTPTYNSLVYI
jgi:hypothetical protein